MIEDANNLSVMSLSSSCVLQTPPPKENPSIPHWFELSVNKKRSIIPATLPIGDMVSKCLGKTPKTKRPKIETLLNIDEDTKQ